MPTSELPKPFCGAWSSDKHHHSIWPGSWYPHLPTLRASCGRSLVHPPVHRSAPVGSFSASGAPTGPSSCTCGLVFGLWCAHRSIILHRWARFRPLVHPPVHRPAPVGPFSASGAPTGPSSCTCGLVFGLWCAHRSMAQHRWARFRPLVHPPVHQSAPMCSKMVVFEHTLPRQWTGVPGGKGRRGPAYTKRPVGDWW